MRKILLLTLALFCGYGIANAQSIVQFGVKGGLLINSSNLKYTSSNNSLKYDHSSTKPGFELGFQARVRLPLGFLIQPEVVYSRTSGKFPADGGESLKIRSNWIEVPVLVGWKVSIFRLMAGPSFRFPMDEVLNAGREEARVTPQLDNFIMGYQAGVGLDLGRLTIDARYCGNFTNITDESVAGANYIPDLKVNERKVAISIGYMILK